MTQPCKGSEGFSALIGKSCLQVLATSNGAMKCAPLAVSGAFHTSLMQPARDQLVKVRPVLLHFCCTVEPRLINRRISKRLRYSWHNGPVAKMT